MVSTYILQETLSQERHLFFIPESLIVFYAQRSLSVLYLYIHTTRAILFHLRSEERKASVTVIKHIHTPWQSAAMLNLSYLSPVIP